MDTPLDMQKVLASIDEVLGSQPGPKDVVLGAARLKECIDHSAPDGSVWRRMADHVRLMEGNVTDKTEARLREILRAFKRELVEGESASASSLDEATWLAALPPFPTETAASHAALLKTVERAFQYGREARVLALVAREASTVPWKAVFGRIDLVRRGDPAPLAIHPKGNVRAIEERPPRDVLLDRLAEAVGGGPFQVGDVMLPDHAMDTLPWSLHRHHQNALDYGTGWPCLVIAPLDQIKSRPFIESAIQADGPVPVFMGLDHLAWAISGFRATPGHGLDIRPRRFQVLVWDYRGRIDRFRSTGTKLIVSVSPPGDPALRLVAIAHGETRRVPLTKDAPGQERLDLGEQIVRATATLRRGDDVVVEHALDLPRDQQFAELGSPRLSGEFGEAVAADASAPASPGVTPAASPWTLVQELGQGGQGVAHLVFRSEPYQYGVMKVLHRHPGASDATLGKARARFRREIQVTSSLEHPFILQVLDAQAEGDEPWVVTEYMSFGSLQQHLHVFRGDLWRSLRVARDVAVALGHLHGKGLVHRDVKPSNILLRSLDHPVLGDFGIVYDPEGTDLTSTDEKVAARWYGPPEAEHGRYDDPPPNFDVYSLGKVIWALLSGGAERFLREDFRGAKHDLVGQLARPEVEAVNRLLDRMIVAEPAKRLQTAAEVVGAIDGVLGEFFGSGGANRCRHCSTGSYEVLGKLLFHPSGYLVQGSRIEPIAEICKTCGDMRITEPETRTKWSASRSRS